MEFKLFLKQRRLSLGLTQSDVAEGLTRRGYNTSSGRVGHWETGRNKPPLIDERFRNALAAVLEMDVNEMMTELGYVISETERSQEAQLAATIVDTLPPDARQLALDYLHVLEKRFATSEN